jgi:hypothetical protein
VLAETLERITLPEGEDLPARSRDFH